MFFMLVNFSTYANAQENFKPHKKLLNKEVTLVDIKSKDEYIQEQVKKLKIKFKKNLYKKEIDKLFFLHPKRNMEFYAWWNKEEQEVVILSYGKK